MEASVLVIDACPNSDVAVRRLREALDQAGLSEVTVTTVIIRTPDDATGVPFSGSPTLIVDGEDLFPGGGLTRELSCRVYPTPDGLAGAPTVQQIADALNLKLPLGLGRRIL